jgi:hypothetical protein
MEYSVRNKFINGIMDSNWLLENLSSMIFII